MKYLGIDYGTKKIGIAVSDERGTLAFPYSIITYSPNLVLEISTLIEREQIGTVVVGKSHNMDGQENSLQQKINSFVEQLAEKTSVPIVLEQEWMSSVAARSHFYSKGNIANPKWTGKQNQKKRSSIDDSAAAVILQRYLDKQ